MMTHIGNAALAALKNATKARAEHLRQLERAMMLDPDPEYRAQAKAEYLKLTAPRCERCAGLGRVFVCRHWPRCNCTDEVIERDCSGHSATCPECGGKGNTQLVASTSTAELTPETAEAERIANEVLEALSCPAPPTAGGGE